MYLYLLLWQNRLKILQGISIFLLNYVVLFLVNLHITRKLGPGDKFRAKYFDKYR